MSSGVKIQNLQELRLEQNLAKILFLLSSSLCIYRLLGILVANTLGTRKYLVLSVKYTLRISAREIDMEHFPKTVLKEGVMSVS